MKKLIAAALAILLSSTGYVIVDHTLEDRVTVLEGQVSNLEDELNSFKNTTYYTGSFPINQPKYKHGDSVPVDKSQKYSFNMQYASAYWDSDDELEYKNYFIYDIDYSENPINSGYNRNIEVIDNFELKITDIKFTVCDEDKTTTTHRETTKNTKPTTAYESVDYPTTYDYSNIKTTKFQNYTYCYVNAIVKGSVPSKYAGYKISFDVSYNQSCTYLDHAIINSDGTFEFEGCYYIDSYYSSLGINNPRIFK